MARKIRTRTKRVKRVKRKSTMKKCMRKCRTRCRRKCRSYKKKCGGSALPVIVL